MNMAEKILVYHLWPLAWGSLKAMTLFLSKIKALGADYVWLSPIFQSPLKNHGYDVSDYYAIDSRFGTNADFDEFVRVAHTLGLRVILELVLDSTSVEHRWFYTDPGRYVWNTSATDWQNLFDHGSAWQFDEARGKYYLHLSHPAQADLNWYQGGVLNRSLVEYFRNVMMYWIKQRDVDGFRVGNIQHLNKNISKHQPNFNDLLTGANAITALNYLSNVYQGKSPFIMVGCIDRDGDVIEHYSNETDVEFITSSALKSSIIKGCSIDEVKRKIDKLSKNPKFMLDLESNNSVRITSQSGLSGKEVIDLMFSPSTHAVCLYQGQELGLKNPTERELPMVDLSKLDAKATLLFERSYSSAESLRQESCANTRLPLSLAEYTRQEVDENSILNYAKLAIQKWKA